jgi:hypothetical protein
MVSRIACRILSVIRCAATSTRGHSIGGRLLGALSLLGVLAPTAMAAVKRSYTPIPQIKNLPASEIPDPTNAPGLAQTRDRARQSAEERHHRSRGDQRGYEPLRKTRDPTFRRALYVRAPDLPPLWMT